MGLLEKGLDMESSLIKNAQGATGKLKTDIDRLYYVIKSQGKITIKDAGKSLGIDRVQTEDYARILFEQNLIDVKRPLFGDTVLLSLDKNKKLV